MGEVFAGRYELIDLIGEGGMGAVWRVHDRRRNTIVAAKVLRQSDAAGLLRFMREQGVRIHHPHVVTPIGWAGEDDTVLFTMPVFEGGSVADLLKKYGILPPLIIAEVLRQLLSALGAVHDAGVIHRDVKAGNLLLESTDVQRPFVRLTDFGVAIDEDTPRMTTQPTVFGTPGFIAPEVMAGGSPSRRSDLYAVGMVGLQMLTGDEPAIATRTERADLPQRPEDVPDELWRILTELVDPDPLGRPQSAAEALEALQHGELAWVAQTQVSVDQLLRPPVSGFSTATAEVAAASTVAAALVDPAAYLPSGAGGSNTAALRPSATRAIRPERHRGPVTSRFGAASTVSRTPSSRVVSVALLGAPILALAALAGVWLIPWGDAQPHPVGTTDVNGVCSWQDAGTNRPAASGARPASGRQLTCRAVGQGYRWTAE